MLLFHTLSIYQIPLKSHRMLMHNEKDKAESETGERQLIYGSLQYDIA